MNGKQFGRYPSLEGRGPRISDMSDLSWGVIEASEDEALPGTPFHLCYSLPVLHDLLRALAARVLGE